MSPQSPNITLGTAGHVDHGKTALLKNLTGCETDRLREEKERGLSIELGFAPCLVGDGRIGIVDVPGHENFIKTMVAGASGMDGVLLVVAADDGVMPQTREHLDILTLLGIRYGLVALTKIDKVSDEERALAEDDVRGYIQNTFLADAPIIPLSNVTGEGFGDLCDALAALVPQIPPRSVTGVFRQPVERAFSIKGHGTVISGIPVSGVAHTDDELELLPGGTRGTIRDIEVYGEPSDAAQAGECAAFSVRQFDADTVKRGDVVATPGYFAPHEWFACTLRLLPLEGLHIKSGEDVKLHTGTAEAPASVYLMEGDTMPAGAEDFVQVRTSKPIVADSGDGFILRSLSPARTIGGGVIVEPVERRLKRTRPEVHARLRERAESLHDPDAFLAHCLRAAEEPAVDEKTLAVLARVPHHRLDDRLRPLVDAGVVIELMPRRFAHVDRVRALEARVTEMLAAHHADSPESVGLTRRELMDATGITRNRMDALLDRLQAAGALAESADRYALAGHTPDVDPADRAQLTAMEALFRDGGFRPPRPEQVAQRLGIDDRECRRLLDILREHRRLIRVAEGIVFHHEAVEEARRRIVEHIEKEGRLESVDFKYLIDTSRKFALPLLDYFDRLTLTRRDGYTRHLRTPDAPIREA